MNRIILAILLALSFAQMGFAKDLQWAKVKASDRAERTAILEAGVSIEAVNEDDVVVLATEEELNQLKKQFEVTVQFAMDTMDFPVKDSNFHNYTELTAELQKLANENPNLVSIESIGKSLEGRDMWALTITSNQKAHLQQAGILFMGGHHAREHISVEMPLKLAQYLVSSYNAKDARVQRLLDSRSVYIIPVVNPDGKDHDVSGDRYHNWRKNRRQNKDGTWGVDLNRNYDFNWGTVGISHNPSSDVYCGPSAFSEPETQNMRDFYLSHDNLTVNLSYHTFSELILYPWGYTNNKITKDLDYQTHSTMAQTMAKWNGYTPQQSSELYLTSGDTSDWAYGVRGLISFTFELDPQSIFQGGFYPGQSYIEPVFQKNLEPALYLIEYTDNPYRVTQPTHEQYGLNSALIQ